jgi:hypothetical protein
MAAKPTTNTKACPCGQMNPANARTCIKCGRSLAIKG